MKPNLYKLLVSLSFLFLIVGNRYGYAQYCTTGLYTYGCQYSDYIDGLSVGSINQTSTGCASGSAGYTDYTQLSTDLEFGSTYQLTVSVGNYGEYVSMWIDFNDDSIFEASEKMVSYLYCYNSFTNFSSSFFIPWTAPPGQHRMRVRCAQYTFPIDPCAQYYYGEVEDYSVNIIPPSNMSYVSSTTTQTNTTATSSGSSDVEIIGVKVVTTGSLNPLSATSFALGENGTTNFSGDVTNVKVYYTGTDPNFAATNLVGSTTSLPGTVTGNQTLAAGANYFWVAYDLSATATIGDFLDAQCNTVTLSSGVQTPAVTDPAGNREINYCTPVATYSCYFAYIDGVELNTLSNVGSGCNGNFDGYISYAPTGSLTTSLEIGSSYAVTLTGPAFEPVGLGMWIDFNNDGDFSDPGEFVYGTPTYSTGAQVGSVVIPNNSAFIGDHRMRVRAKDYGTVSSGESCTEYTYGEAEDYTVTLTSSTPMVYVSSTTTQDTDFLQSGASDAEIIGIQVVTSGSQTPFDVTSLVVNANGTTLLSDVTNLKIYYTGTNPVFSATGLFGSTTSLSGTITINGNQELSSGTNYFWVAYDVSSTSTIGDYLDAECTSIVMNGAGGTQVPSPTAPTGNRQINYCTPTTTYGCSYGYIDGVIFNTLSNTSTGCNGNPGGYINYPPSGNLTTTVEIGSTYNITLEGPPTYDPVGFGVWIDYNNDGDFDDAGEFVYNSPFATTGPQTGSITIPNNSAYIGDHRMRVRSKEYYILFNYESCGELLYYYGESEDYTITLGPPSAMSYLSSTTTQDNLSTVTLGQSDAEIMGIQVSTQGSISPFDLTSLTVNTNGSTDPTGDITNIKIYYTGTSPNFAPTNLFGSTTNTAGGTITGLQTLAPGTNYFWVAYDVSSSGSLGDYLDAECTSITMDGAGGTQTPLVTAPSGYRVIDFCVGTYTNPCSSGDYIDNFTFNTLSNLASGCNGNANNYIDYAPTGTLTTSVEGGQTYDIMLQSGSTSFAQGFGVWIDFNNNSSFADPGEFVYFSPYASTSAFYGTITIPANASVYGDRRMRVRCAYDAVLGDTDYCNNQFYGETEDYTITITPSTVNMTYVSTTCTQNNVDAVGPGQQDVEILGIQVVTDGGLNPFNATSFTVNSTGTSVPSDITNAKIYYTGNGSSFAPINLFGSATNLSNPITGSQTLTAGTNYFWLAYDVSPTASFGDFLDAECTQVVMDGAGGTQTPAVTAPLGNREINYCMPSTTYGCYYGYIDGVTLNTLSNTFSGCNGNINGYIEYPPTDFTTSLDMGTTYTLTLVGGPSYDYVGFGVWIDYNNDGDFDDPGEFVFSSPYYTYGTQTGTITVPNNAAYVGDHRMRVRSKEYGTIAATDACNLFLYYYGESEDYTITINTPPACTGVPVVGAVTADPQVLCTAGGTVSLALDSYSTASDIAFQWQQSSNNISWSDISGATNSTYDATVNSSTYYRNTLTCTNSGQSASSTGTQVEVGGSEQVSSVTGATICGQGTADLQAQGTGDYLLWYTDATGGAPVYYSPSPSNYSPYLNNTTTYYVSAATGVVNIDGVGPDNDSIGPVYNYYTYNYQLFNVYANCTLEGVYVYPVAAGNVVIEWDDANYQPIQTATVAVTANQINQKTFIPLNFSLTPGTGYHLAWNYQSVNLASNDYSFTPYAYPYTIPNIISITGSVYGSNYYFYFYDWQVNFSTLCETPTRTAVVGTVTPAPAVTVTPNPLSAAICNGSGSSVQLTAAGPYTSFTWTPADGLNTTSGTSVSATPATSTTYIVNATDGTCNTADTVSVYVVDPPQLTVTASPNEVCAGGTSQLTATTPALNYNVLQIPFAPDQNGPGTLVGLGDDQMSSALPVGFTFNFYGNDYTQFYIGSNGFISFDPFASTGCCEGQLLPNPTSPNDLIALAWEDYDPPLGGTISYYTTGTAPFRKLVVDYDAVPHFSANSDLVTEQAILYESTNIIEIHTTAMPGNPSGLWLGHTEGIENADGTLAAFVPGRNDNNTWTATDDAWQFSPSQYTYSWTPVSSLSDATASAPVATPPSSTTYTVTVTDNATLCSSTGTATVDILQVPNTGVITTPLATFCANGATTLSLDGYSPGASIQWAESATSGGPYTNISGATTDSYTTPNLTSTTYYVANVTCASGATSPEQEIEINYPPNPPVAIDGGHCGPGVVNLGATGTGSGAFNWYYSQSGTNYLGSGSSFTTPFINTTTTFWVEEGLPAPAPLPTTYSGFYTYENGAMFDITAINDVYITGFDMNMNTGTSDFEIYYKSGSYVGYETNAAPWILAGSASGVSSAGVGNPTPIPASLYIHIPAGETYGFYLTSSNYTYIYYSPGTSVGNVYSSDANIQVKEGSATYYPFGYPSTPSVWNGTVHYVAPGCASPRTPVIASIYSPQVVASASSNAICEGTTIQLIGQNLTTGDFNYAWSPAIPGMIPQDGLSDTVTVTPQVTTTFTVDITSADAGCDTSVSVTVTVSPIPAVFISGLNPQYYNTDPPVTLVGIPPGGTFTGPGVSGNTFSPGTVGLGTYTITYTYTDANGCTGTSSQDVNVVALEGIGGITDDYSVMLYPNPTTGLFVFDIQLPAATQDLMMRVFNVIGQPVFDNDFGAVTGDVKKSFDFSNLAAGPYYIQLVIDGQVIYRKLTIQK